MTTMDGNELRFEFAALPERVWDALTNPTKAAAWLPDGPVGEIGRRFTLRDSWSGQVIAVDPPSRVALRWHRPARLGAAAAEGAMTWVVAPAPGGAAVRVIMSPVDDPTAHAELAAALQTLFDVRLRVALRSRTPASIARPVDALQAAPVAVVDLATPAAGSGPAGSGADADGPSQAVSFWPVLGRAKARRRKQESRRRPGGLALALRLVAVIVVAAALGAITFGAPSIPWAAAPDESTLDDVADNVGSPSSGGLDPTPQVGGGAGATGGTATGTTSAGTPEAAATTTVPTLIPPLAISLDVVNEGLLSYTVDVTVSNPAGVAQTWQNAAIEIDGLQLTIEVATSLVSYHRSGTARCFAPTGSASIAPGGAARFTFTVMASLANLLKLPAGVPLLNQTACG